MKGLFTTMGWIAVLLVLACIPSAVRAEDNDLPIYFDDSTLVLKTQTVNRIQYVPLAEIVRHLSLPNTNDPAQDVITIRGTSAQPSQVQLTKNSASISVNNQITMLSGPALHDNGTWLVPIDFLNQGLFRITGIEFRQRAGAPRVFAGTAKPVELTMTAQFQGTLTRLTLRTSTPVSMEMRREAAQHRAVLTFIPKQIDPARETLDYKDHLVESVSFNDSDGAASVIVDISDEVSDIRVLSADENRVHFVDFIRKADSTESAPTPAPAKTTGTRVIVIDPGHGGTDSGASTMGALEKDLTLALARKLRATLQSRLGATVLLTRDSDVPLSSEARASAANNNQADLFLSLHIGTSSNKGDLGSSVYVIQDNFAASLLSADKSPRLFLPWYLGYRMNRPTSLQAAGFISEELSASFPGWKFPVRNGPVAVLASTTMPSVLIEVGNLNNPASAQALLDETFQNKFSVTVASAMERFSATRPAEKPEKAER